MLCQQIVAVLALVPLAFSTPIEDDATVEDRNATLMAGGTTYFTGDGYYHTDCTGNKYWSWEVSEQSRYGCLNEKEEIGSVWIHDYGACKGGMVLVDVYSKKDCTGNSRVKRIAGSRGTCMKLPNDGWGFYSIGLMCGSA